MPSILSSFFIGGFECATHRRRDKHQIDVISRTKHDAYAAEDYRILQHAGIGTVRDGLRWHLIEKMPGVYDWSSFLPMLDASIATSTQVIWDICHWGVPVGLDIFSEEFVIRFRDFAAAAAQVVFDRTGGFDGPVPFYCPINEISFWSWVGGDVETFWPYQESRGAALKQQLVLASLAAIKAIRNVDPRARFIQAEPVIHIVPDDGDLETEPELVEEVRAYSDGQFEAWDMLVGRHTPELGGASEALDLIGVNYYWNNQWVHEGDRTPPGHPDHKPLHIMLQELWLRYGRPILITETGAEADAAAGWLGYITAEVRQAQRLGVEVLGICIYPVMDYPGWDNDRHCPCGLIEVSSDWSVRTLRHDFAAEVKIHTALATTSAESLTLLSTQ